MSKRPIAQKKRKRVAKVFRRTPLPAYIDLVQWLVDHGHARTKREARDLILAKRVKAESHVLGVQKATVPATTAVMDVLMGREPRMEVREVVAPYVDAQHRRNIVVLDAPQA